MKTFSTDVIKAASALMLEHCAGGKQLLLSKFDKALAAQGFNVDVLNLYDLIKSGDLDTAKVKFCRTGEKFFIKSI